MATLDDLRKSRGDSAGKSRWDSEQQPTPPPDKPTGADQPPQDGPTKDPNVLNGNGNGNGNGWNDGPPATPDKPQTPQPAGPTQNPPKAPGALAGPSNAPQYDPEEAKHRRALDILMLQQQHDRDKWKREDEYRWAQLEQQNRAQESRQRRPRKFTATMNGMGQSSFKVVWDTGGKSRTVSSDTSAAPGGWGRPGGRRSVGNRASYRGADAVDKKKASNVDAMLQWMPIDSLAGEEDARDFVAADFTDDFNPNGTGRFQGGYLDPEFQRRYIEGRMNGLVEGDAGYTNRRAAVESMWRKQKAQYDKAFRLYGKNALAEQARRKEKQQAAKGGDTETIATASAQQIQKAVKLAANAPVRRAR